MSSIRKQKRSIFGGMRKATIFDFLKFRTALAPLVAYRAARAVKLFLRTTDARAQWLLKHLQAKRIINADSGNLILLRMPGGKSQ